LTLESGFPPELASGRLPFEFASQLAKLGHNVVVVTIFPRKYLLNKKGKIAKWKFFYQEQMDGFDVIRFRPQFSSNSLASRMLEHVLIPASLFIGGLASARKDMVIHCTIPPLFIGFSACLIGRLLGTPVVVRVQDVHPDALVKLGLLKNRLLIKFLEFAEKLIYLCADHLTVIGETYRKHIISKGVYPSKVTLIPNWADTAKIPSSNNPSKFLKDMGLEKEFIVTYAGTMSWPQDLETVVEAANMLRNHKDIMFLLVGDGVKKKILIERSKALCLSNIRFLPLQSREKYFEILDASNVCLVSLRKSFESPSVPSKMLDIMACGKPVIANVPIGGDVSEILKKAKCGLAIEPENPHLLAKAILMLLDDDALAEELGKNGRKYLDKHFSISTCIDKYEQIMTNLINKAQL
jgi:glycosyltransferase involved in cell wall biosynthesis